MDSDRPDDEHSQDLEESTVRDQHEGYGLDYTGTGFRCPNCEFVGTYLTCQKCGTVMDSGGLLE